jgi:FtsP/CotA-like multicopper oxidase with cupredoxin domain
MNIGRAASRLLSWLALPALFAGAAYAAAPTAAPYAGVLPGAVTANWTPDPADPAGTVYEAQLSDTADFTGVVLTSATLNAFAGFTGLLPNTTYYGQVRVQSPVTAYTPLGLVFLPPEAPGPAAATLVQHAALTANWTTGANPADTVYEAVISNLPGFDPGTASTVTTTNPWATFTGLTPGTLYYLKVRALDRFGAPTAYTALAATLTRAAAPLAGGTPDYINYPNYATSPLPVVTGGVVSGGIRKFIDTLPGLGPLNPNNRGLFIPVATAGAGPDASADYYSLELVDYTQQLHPDLPPTKLRGYREAGGAASYLGPFIIARKDRPVRLTFTNKLAPGTAGDLFLPVDTTLMGAGLGPDGVNMFPQNRANLHLHGGDNPWISDGSPHQWITPAGEPSPFKRGASARNVPDMADPGPGAVTYYFPNGQSSRLMWFHDHSHGLTRLNVYAGEAAGYLLTDPAEEALITAALPDLGGAHHYGIPLILQDKTFVPPPAQLAAQDPTWDTARYGGAGNVWFPHVYVPAENPADPSGVNPLGRWSYGPWAVPPAPVAHPPLSVNAPNLPNPSLVPESFFDTMVVNGVPYPRLDVTRRAYRFRILNAANDRTMNLQLYYADPANPTEVKMVPAVVTAGFPASWPTDGREGGVPDPATAGPALIQIGTEGGLLPAPAVLPNQPVDFDPVTGNISAKTLLLAPAERADVVIDFSGVPAGVSSVILYNDAPAPGADPRYDFYTGKPDQTLSGGTPTTLPGYGPNTRTVMRFDLDAAAPAPAFDLANLTTALATAFTASNVKPVPASVSPALNDETAAFTTLDTAQAVTLPLQRKTVDETYEGDYGRLRSSLGVQPGPGSASPAVQFGFVDPATEIVRDGELQLWRVKNYTGDIHPIHFHLFNVQIISRVNFTTNALIPPDANEAGWKETVRVNPGEDAIVALRPKKPVVPFQLPDSVRYLDPTIPPNSPMGFSMTGPLGTPVAVTNVQVNFGHEYVWHCHILGHEENDFMRPIYFQTAPGLPGAVTVTPGNGVAVVAFSTGPTGGLPVTNYTVTAAGPGGPFTASGPASPITVPGLTNGVAYTFTVTAANAAGTGPATAASAPAVPQVEPVAEPYTGVLPGAVKANWSGAGNTPGTVYEVQLSTYADFSAMVLTSATLNAFADFSGLLPNTTYYGQVRVQSPVTAYTPLGLVFLPPEAPGPAVATRVQHASLTANWTTGANPADTVYEAVLSNTPGFDPGTASTVTTTNSWATFTGLTPGTLYYLKVRALDRFGAPTAYTALAATPTRAAAPLAGGTPDYLNYPNFANSPLPVVTGGVVSGGIRKFIDSLPGLGFANKNNLNQFIPVATPNQTLYDGSDYYELGLVDYTQQLHTDLGPTKLRGYKDLLSGDGQAHYLGPLIIARKGRPVRLKLTNQLSPGPAGNLFLPVDTTVMGAGTGPDGVNIYPQNRAVIHLHGGDSPWISDGTPHQWITPAGEPSIYNKGASQQNVPDMGDPGAGAATYFWPNQQSSRLMWYHDHVHGLTRLNAYAGEAAGYLLTDPAEEALIATPGALPDLGGFYHYGIPLIIQDKSFVPPAPQLAQQDPTWDTAKWGGPGSLWYPHVYMPAENPADPSGVNPLGRWSYGPWAVPPAAVTNPPVGGVPSVPNPSIVPEAFLDTPVVNGAAYPYLEVSRRAYRFRVLNASDDRTMNLQLYYADPANPTEVKMVPAVPTPGFPASWPTDGRDGGVPDPSLAGPPLIQIGTEGGLLPAPVVMGNQPMALDANGNISTHTLILGPAERADIVVDFSEVPDNSTLILYNDALAPAPGGDPRYDYYTDNPDQTPFGGAPSTLAGYGPNMRTLMQFRVSGAQDTSFSLPALQTALPAAYAASEEHPVPPGVQAGNTDESKTFTPQGASAPGTFNVDRRTMDENFETTFGRLHTGLGFQTSQSPTAPNVMFGYADPNTEFVKDGELQIWRLKNYTGDIHPVHFHLFNVQVLNRVDVDGTVLPPDPEETGWKETVRVNPSQDIVVALRPKVSTVPFSLPDSIRYLDPTLPPGSSMGFTMVDRYGNPFSVVNSTFNFGHEYTWHCHILGHEENDFMRPMVLLAPPAPPAIFSVTPGNAVAQVVFSTPATGGSPITLYTAVADPGAGPTISATGTSSPILISGLANGTAYTIKVFAANSVGAGAPSPASPPVTPRAEPVAAPYTDVTPDGFTANWTGFGNPPGTVYGAQVSSYADFSEIAAASATANSFARFTLRGNATYYAQVRVQSPVTAYTPLGLLYVPSTLTGLNPDVDAVSSTTLRADWKFTPGTLYDVRLAADSGFTSILDSDTLSGGVKTYTGLKGDEAYYFSVKVATEAYASFAVNTYRKETLPPATALSPVLTASSHSVTAVWQQGFPGASYKAALSANALFSMILSSGTVAGLTKTYSGLAPGRDYYFRVKVSTESDYSYYFSSASVRTLTTVTPVTPAVIPVSSTTIRAEWPSVPGAGYDCVLALDSGLTTVVSSGACTGPAVYPGLNADTDYYFGVKLSTETDAGYVTLPAPVRTGTSLTPLAPVLTALSSTTLSGSWNAGGGDYVVALAADSAFTSIVSSGTQAGTTAVFSGLGGGGVYYLAVKVSTESDAAYSMNGVSVATLPGETPLVPSLTAVSSTSLLATWTGGAAACVAVLGADAGFTTLVSSSAVTGGSMLYNGLSGGREYFFKVKLSSETDTSYVLNSVSALTSPTVTTLAPSLTAVSSVTLRAAWAGCGSGCVAVLAADSGFAAVLSSTTETGAWKDFTGLAPDTAYYFKVKLSTEADASYAVNALSALTLHPVTGLSPAFTEISTTALTASWTPIPGASYVTVLAADSGCTSVISSGTQTGSSVTYSGLSHYTGYHFEVKLSTETDDSYLFNRASAATAAGEQTLSRLWPAKAAWKAGGVELNASGTWFVPGSTVTLTRAGHPDVVMTNVSVVSPTQLSFTLGQACATGRWNLSVSGAGRTTVLPDAFTLLAAPAGTARVFQGVFKPGSGESAQLATSLLAGGNASIKVYDVSGRFVREIFNGFRAAGDYLDEWDGRNGEGSMCSSGVYVIRFACPGFTSTKRVVMVK